MLAVSSRRVRSFVIAVISCGLSVLACSASNSINAGGGGGHCDSTKCAPGNTCLPLGGETKCRKTCSSNADPSTSCPFGYTCTDTQQANVPPFCVQDTAVNTDGKPLVKKPGGQWGFPCQASQGITNPACDTDQGFYCYGDAPTDGDAYCTRYDCEKDSDCGAGFWCAKINTSPNVETAKHRVIGEVQNACLRRVYCSTCTVDLDCPPIKGKAQHCIVDGSGTSICSPECDGNQACPNEAKCVDPGIGTKTCFPRATVCVGDGSLCSPCRVDTDCGDDGVCVKGQYTTEHTCAKKSTSSCGNSSNPTQGSCPQKLTDGSKASVRCLGSVFNEVPPDYCHGIYSIGAASGSAAPDIGCWTPAR